MVGRESENTLTPLTAISPIDGRYRSRVEELAPFTSEEGLIKTRVEVEAKYLIALSEAGVIRGLTADEKKELQELGPSMTSAQAQEVKDIESETRHDVKAVERWIRNQIKATSLSDMGEFIHFCLTSEDVNNLSYRLMLDRARNSVMIPVLDKITDELCSRAHEFNDVPMLARTHGQPAVPTTLGKEIAVFAVRLNKESRMIQEAELTGKLNGAVGNFNAHKQAAPEINWINFSEKFIKSLGFEPNPYTTQINPYEDMINLFQAFQRVNGILLDFDQDIWRYISDDWFVQEVKEQEVGSSTMPQKVNPIDFEGSEGNLVMANGFWETMSRKLPISRLQRDLSDSTVIRNVGVVLAYQLLAYKNLLVGLERIKPNEQMISAVLNDNWAILTEGVQAVLRKEGVEDPYMLVKGLVRGQKITRFEWSEWIDKLPVDDRIKTNLRNLTPESYIGEARELTIRAVNSIVESRNSPN